MEAGSVRRQNATFNAGKITNAAYEINIQTVSMCPCCVQVSPFSNAPECVTGADSLSHYLEDSAPFVNSAKQIKH